MTQSPKEKIEEVLSCIPLDTQAGEKEVNELVSILPSELVRALEGVREAVAHSMEENFNQILGGVAHGHTWPFKMNVLSAFDRSVEELRK